MLNATPKVTSTQININIDSHIICLILDTACPTFLFNLLISPSENRPFYRSRTIKSRFPCALPKYTVSVLVFKVIFIFRKISTLLKPLNK